MHIEAVLFDIGGVLLTLGEATYRQQLAARIGLPNVPPCYDEMVIPLQRGELAETQFWSELAGRPVEETLFDDAWLAHFQPIPAMLNLAAQLRELGIRIGVLSNTQKSHVRLMHTMGFLNIFDPVIMSCEVGMRKPEPAIYQYALDQFNLPASKVAYVDDHPAYIAAARALGLQVILHTGDAQITRAHLLSMSAHL